MASLSFFARPPPLGAPATAAPAPTAPKRPATTPLLPAKRAKLARTPEPQHPAMHRVRAPPTPSTSTVAASSSPRRLLSSPHRSSKHHFSAPVPVHLDGSTTLVFGRHRRAPAGLAPPPPTLLPLLTTPQNPARTVGLDRSARHASRVHAAAELVDSPHGPVIRLLVLGQNGVRVLHGGAARRLRAGAVVEFAADEPLNVDFYGAAVLIRTEEEHELERERLFTPEPRDMHAIHSPVSMPPSSLPPSSPPVMHMDDESEAEAQAELDEDVKEQPAPTPRSVVDLFSRDSSPLSEPEDEPKEPKVLKKAATPAPGPAPTPNLDALPAAPSPSPAVPAASRQGTPKPKSRAPTPPVELPPFPAALDLPALLASTVVFSGSSKLSLPDLVKALLESQPSLRDHGDDKLWAQWAAAELETNPMFGKVARNGKDASGRPLLAHYFYNPAADPDPSRAKELGGLVRPLRAAQRTGGKVIDWRPVSSRRRYHY